MASLGDLVYSVSQMLSCVRWSLCLCTLFARSFCLASLTAPSLTPVLCAGTLAHLYCESCQQGFCQVLGGKHKAGLNRYLFLALGPL